MDPVNVPAKFEVRSFTRFWDNSGYLKNFGQFLNTPSKLTQGRWFWYQSKASMQLPISLPGSERIFYFCKSDVSVVQGRSRSLILVPIESAYMTSY